MIDNECATEFVSGNIYAISKKLIISNNMHNKNNISNLQWPDELDGEKVVENDGRWGYWKDGVFNHWPFPNLCMEVIKH